MRPTALNPERQATILNAIKTGAPQHRAAAYGGVTDETVRKWRSKGEAALLIPAGDRSPTQRLYAGFVGALDEALAHTAIRMQAVVFEVATQKEDLPLALKAATWWLSHRENTTYTTRQEITGKDGAPLEMSAGEAWDKLLALTGREAESPEPDDDGEDAEIVRIA